MPTFMSRRTFAIIASLCVLILVSVVGHFLNLVQNPEDIKLFYPLAAIFGIIILFVVFELMVFSNRQIDEIESTLF